ncbi:hypothetical protein [Massilia sp. CCM 8734]|uniref:DUF6892 domain-containing protein n=1 Tax=Massilia sp. CCM 8734 TaxID=2609283 RepID=UPI00141EC573|nr:hypothetical protein [Massilia sp. CCM 8734]NHZ96400.1 hypothetical protein [Massilia sp. CCM 8734]
MLSKDLLYALQTRSKKLIRELENFTNDIKNVSAQDGWTLVIETMKLVRELTPTHEKYSHVIKAVNRAWLAFADQADAAADELYRYVAEWLGQTDWMHEDEAQAAYQLLYAFHANHLRFPGANEHLRHGLRQQSSSMLSLILYLVPYSTQTLFKVPVKPHTGVGADAIRMLLRMYFYHTGLCEDDDLRADAAGMLPLLVRANPHIGDGLALCLLKGHPERADIVCQLIELYLDASERERVFGMFHHTMLELLDNDGDSFVYEELDKITARLAVSSARWTSDQLDTFAEHAFFYRLNNDEDRRLLLSKSAKARRLARMIIDSAHCGTHIDMLRSLYHALGDDKPVAPPLASAPQFADLNFKLLVIQKLMYEEETLLPRFDVQEFIRQYTSREIMIKKEGYDVIPEVLGYFDALVIPPQLLAQVEELSFDASAEIYSQVFPYWDGECDTFELASVIDIGLLPNLKCMSYMSDQFLERHATTLRQKGIDID